MNNAPGTIVIPGGSGYLGEYLAGYFADRGHRVVILTRTPQADRERIEFLAWDGKTLGPWAQAIDGAQAVINLAGRSVNCRYTAANRREIYASRLDSTNVIGAAIAARAAQGAPAPALWINSSSATIYRHALDRPMDELTGEIGSGFSVDVCQRWEQALDAAPTPATRKVALRAAMVFGKGRGGVMEAFERIVRLGLGGPMAGGGQFVSWVHLEDFARAIEWIMAREDLSGAINLAAPNPRTNRDFLKIMRHICRQPLGLPAARWMLEIGAFVLRSETELLLKSRRVVPTRLLRSGFVFRYPELYPALDNIINR